MNFYKLIDKKGKQDVVAGIRQPSNILLISPTAGGKTNYILNYIKESSGYYHNIIICTRNSNEPLYDLVRKKIKEVKFYENCECPDIDDFDSEEKTLLIFDDCLLSNNPMIKQYFIAGRKQGITTIYLGQSYFKIDKLIRMNISYIWIKKLSSIKDLKLILREYSMENDLDSMMAIYKQIDFLNALCIDIQNSTYYLR